MEPRIAYLISREDAIHRAGVIMVPPGPTEPVAEARKALKMEDGDHGPIRYRRVPEFDDIPIGDQFVSIAFLAHDAKGHKSLLGDDFSGLPDDRMDSIAKTAADLLKETVGDHAKPAVRSAVEPHTEERQGFHHPSLADVPEQHSMDQFRRGISPTTDLPQEGRP
jgi:hypothetical protein